MISSASLLMHPYEELPFITFVCGSHFLLFSLHILQGLV